MGSTTCDNYDDYNALNPLDRQRREPISTSLTLNPRYSQ